MVAWRILAYLIRKYEYYMPRSATFFSTIALKLAPFFPDPVTLDVRFLDPNNPFISLVDLKDPVIGWPALVVGNNLTVSHSVDLVGEEGRIPALTLP